MNKSLKKFIIRVLLSGAFFALTLFAFDATEGKEFNLLKFLMRMIVFGIGMTLIQNYFNTRRLKIKKV